jgi:hypothetical protein
VFFVSLVMAAIVVDVQIKARRGQRRMDEIVAHQPQTDLLVRHVRTGGMPQPVRRGVFEQVRMGGKGLATFA